ncbi:MAG TPA: alcohol dehydrogenase catalytic domain-containing protein [Ktedonobacteraceae bacterium]|nr:alcohol dehydrogenase catalytic domain-containing protein [Ktedonobacteraceae bacterium]
MKAARYFGPGDIRITDIPEPPLPGRGMVKLQMLMGSVCGTDASQYRRATMVPLFQPHPVSEHSGPVVLGHEVVGTVIEKGRGVDLEIGQRVVPSSAWSCGSCPQCRAGRTSICQGYYLLGIHADGGFAEKAIYPAAMCVPVPEQCSTEAAAMAQPCGIALHAINRASVQEYQTIAVFGIGGIGSLVLALLRARWGDGLPIIAVDIDDQRLNTAELLGATHTIHSRVYDPVVAIRELTRGYGPDVIFEATGVPAVIKQAFYCLGNGGRLVQLGIPIYPVTLPFDEMSTREKEVLGSNGLCLGDLEQALDLLSNTDLAQRIGYHMLDLEQLVEGALMPLLNHQAGKKCLLKLQ